MKPKILLTIPNFNTAGSGKVVYDLAKRLDKEKFDVHIACENKEGEFIKVVEALGLPIHIINLKTTYRPYITLHKRIKKLSEFYRDKQFDVVHSWQWSSDWTEAVAAKMAGSIWIYTKKAMGFKSKHWKIKSWLADFIVTINPDMQKFFKYKKSQKLIPLGIDTDYYSSQTKKHKNENDIFRIVTIANLVPVKGIEVLVKALKLIDINYQLTIVGNADNEYGKYLMGLVNSLGLEPYVNFAGRHSDVRPFLEEADIYVIPTLDAGRKEGLPMALVEAMSIGIPVLGSNISGINYVLKDFPECMFPASDEKVLALKISEFGKMKSCELINFGNEIRAYVQTKFSMQLFISAHEQLYSSLIEER